VADAVEAVDTVNVVFGAHAGSRALHAKGILCKGTFTATPDAATLTRAAHMQGETCEATFRFSNGAGNPHHPDFAPDPRGLAVKIYAPGDHRTDVVCVTTPRFVTKTPDGFVELLKVQASGPAAAVKLPAFFARHPEALKALPSAVPAMRPPASYASVPYHGIHAFRWLDVTGAARHVRYRLVPALPVKWLNPIAARRAGADYLQQELRGRLELGEQIRFSYEVQIAIPGDPVDDPSAAWPRARRRVTVGEFTITGLETERETGGDVLVFDPTRVIDGIEASDDPVLRFRHDAYSESVARRMR
jgi:catalase